MSHSRKEIALGAERIARLRKEYEVAIEKYPMRVDEWNRKFGKYFDAADKSKDRKRKKNQHCLKKRLELREKYHEYITSPQWYEFRASVFAIRGKQCEKCGTKSPPIHCHHLTYKNFGNENPEDVQVLCEKCHKAVHRKIRRKGTARKTA